MARARVGEAQGRHAGRHRVAGARRGGDPARGRPCRRGGRTLLLWTSVLSQPVAEGPRAVLKDRIPVPIQNPQKNGRKKMAHGSSSGEKKVAFWHPWTISHAPKPAQTAFPLNFYLIFDPLDPKTGGWPPSGLRAVFKRWPQRSKKKAHPERTTLDGPGIKLKKVFYEKVQPLAVAFCPTSSGIVGPEIHQLPFHHRQQTPQCITNRFFPATNTQFSGDEIFLSGRMRTSNS